MLSFSPVGAVQTRDTPASPCIRGMVVFSTLEMFTMLLASLPSPVPPSAGGMTPPPRRLAMTVAVTTTAASTPAAMRNAHSPFLLRFFGGAGRGGTAPAGMGRGCT